MKKFHPSVFLPCTYLLLVTFLVSGSYPARLAIRVPFAFLHILADFVLST
jgi:hypothetical protein